MLLERCFRGFLHPFWITVLQVFCSSADTHLKLLDRVLGGARSVFECEIARRRSVAVLCML